MKKNNLLIIILFGFINLLTGYFFVRLAADAYLPAGSTLIYNDITSIFITSLIFSAGFLCISLISSGVIYAITKKITVMSAILMTVSNIIVLMLVSFCYGKIYFSTSAPEELNYISSSLFHYFQLLLLTAFISPLIQAGILKLIKR